MFGTWEPGSQKVPPPFPSRWLGHLHCREHPLFQAITSKLLPPPRAPQSWEPWDRVLSHFEILTATFSHPAEIAAKISG